MQLTDNVDFYNILNHNGNSETVQSTSEKYATTYLKIVHEDKLSQLMNGPVKKALNIPSNVTWGGVFIADCVCILSKANFFATFT